MTRAQTNHGGGGERRSAGWEWGGDGGGDP